MHELILSGHGRRDSANKVYRSFDIDSDRLVEHVELQLRRDGFRDVPKLRRRFDATDAVDRLLDNFLVGHLHLDDEGAVLRIPGPLPALLCGLLGALIVQIRKGDALDASFGRCGCRYFSDAGCSL
ncbi:hypothetical protein VPNG_02122 [Cytospora leucostoma]|uniref:Uncharacterized protein n=1 Tax=Cytospora leucostoma TaxID=1230097 RepID=A0A423XI40_9PEZI|nr:hypothetical protein VPNG_02122 [Cytospora leucostoma]